MNNLVNNFTRIQEQQLTTMKALVGHQVLGKAVKIHGQPFPLQTFFILTCILCLMIIFDLYAI